MSRGTRFCGAVLALAICHAPLSAGESVSNQTEILGETNAFGFFNGNTFDGLWWMESLGAPFLLTLGRDGSVLFRGSLDTRAGRPFDLTPGQGVWKRTGFNSGQAEFLRFVKSPEGNVTGFERLRLDFEFAEDFDHIEVASSFEIFTCEEIPAPPPLSGTVPSCPDPTGDVPGVSPPPLQKIPGTATRVRLTRNRN